MPTAREEWQLETRRLGRRVLVFDELDSTSSHAAELAAEMDSDGLVVLADVQRAGRGQHGRSWHCPPGAGVLMSVVLFPPAALRRPVLLAAWAAVAVCETIRESCGLDAALKWPNDVLLQGHKVAGILIEQGKATVAGIGLNVKQTAGQFAGLPRAGSLALFSASPLETPTVARTLIARLDDEYDRLCRGDLATLEASWKRRLGLLGQEVVVTGHDANRTGRLRELSFDAVMLESEDAELVSLPPESVRGIAKVGDR